MGLDEMLRDTDRGVYGSAIGGDRPGPRKRQVQVWM